MQKETPPEERLFSPAPLKGVVLQNKYHIGRYVGSGASGVVYEGKDVAAGLPVAVKVIERQGASGVRVGREIQLAYSIRHENLVALIDCVLDRDHAYLVFEWVEGVDLLRYLNDREGIDLTRAVRIIRDIAMGMRALHNVGVIHRDLKPENILLNPTGGVRIADFGVASFLSAAVEEGDVTSTGVMPSSFATHEGIVGTPMYMPPEVVKTGIVDARTDLYALGIISYELLTGELPFDGEKPVSEHFEEKRSVKPIPPHELNPHCSKELSHLCLKMLHPDPGYRPETATEVVQSLSRFSSTEYSASAVEYMDQAKVDRISGVRGRRRTSEVEEGGGGEGFVAVVTRVFAPLFRVLSYPLRIFTAPIGKIWADFPLLGIAFVLILLVGLGYLMVNQEGDGAGGAKHSVDALYPGYKSLEGGARSFSPKGKSRVIRSVEDLKGGEAAVTTGQKEGDGQPQTQEKREMK